MLSVDCTGCLGEPTWVLMAAQLGCGCLQQQMQTGPDNPKHFTHPYWGDRGILKALKTTWKNQLLGCKKTKTVLCVLQSGVWVGSVAAAAPGHSRQDWCHPLLSFPFCLFGLSADEQKDLDSHLAQHSSDLSSRCQMLPEYKEIMKVTWNVSQL